jgi:hypothetical protein
MACRGATAGGRLCRPAAAHRKFEPEDARPAAPLRRLLGTTPRSRGVRRPSHGRDRTPTRGTDWAPIEANRRPRRGRCPRSRRVGARPAARPVRGAQDRGTVACRGESVLRGAETCLRQEAGQDAGPTADRIPRPRPSPHGQKLEQWGTNGGAAAGGARPPRRSRPVGGPRSSGRGAPPPPCARKLIPARQLRWPSMNANLAQATRCRPNRRTPRRSPRSGRRHNQVGAQRKEFGGAGDLGAMAQGPENCYLPTT